MPKQRHRKGRRVGFGEVSPETRRDQVGGEDALDCLDAEPPPHEPYCDELLEREYRTACGVSSL